MSEDNLQEWIFFFHYVDPRDVTQVYRVGRSIFNYWAIILIPWLCMCVCVGGGCCLGLGILILFIIYFDVKCSQRPEATIRSPGVIFIWLWATMWVMWEMEVKHWKCSQRTGANSPPYPVSFLYKSLTFYYKLSQHSSDFLQSLIGRP